MAVRFRQPVMLWLLGIVPLLGILNRLAQRRNRAALAAVGRPATVAGQLIQPQKRTRWHGWAYPLAWVLLVVGWAGPRWGRSDEVGVALGRDVVLVIDLSRSMWADDMSDPVHRSRWEAARAGALDLLQAIARRGGHRVAVVVFAAKAKLLCPLTTDYEHVRVILEDLHGVYPPPEIRPGADPTITSGTRLGAALVLAVQTHDRQFTGSQDIILLSDGDDPAAEQKEWLRGVNAAIAATIPVHTVGIGDPTGAIDPSKQRVVIIDDEPQFATALHEEPLQQIARETRGEYLPARREVPALGEFFRSRIEPQPSRLYSGDPLPQQQDRSVWFLAAALALFTLGWRHGR
ncbi:MAG: VWA domain-containing protein [Gemmataceae bacterium]|nr:VWA domain-containing protein [Gemmata sp.]MDW8198437.1 VWA domain-containing protein [Gemmataceae bacterium]